MSNLVSMLYDTSVEVARLREVRRLSPDGPPLKASAATILLGPGCGHRSQVSDQYTRTRKRNDESVSVESRLRGVASVGSRVCGESRQLDELISGQSRPHLVMLFVASHQLRA